MSVGLDLQKRACYGTMTDEDCLVVKLGRFSNAPEGLEEFLEDVEEALVAMEVGYYWQPRARSKWWNI